MGAAGAGCATFLSNCAACLYFFILLFIRRGKTFVCIRPSMFRFDAQIVAGVCNVGIPASIQNLLNVTGMTVLDNFTAVYGSDAVAAMGISQKIAMIPMYIALGFSQGIMPLVSYNYASGDRKRMKDTLIFSMRLSLLFMLAATVFYYLRAETLISFFMDNERIIFYGSRFLRGLCLAMPLLATDFMAVGVFQACGMGSKSLLFAILRKIVLEIPALVVLNRLFPLYGLAYAQPVAELVLAITAVLVLARMFRGFSKEDAGKK
jgi:Na+-driven multidrug efflux pump